MLKTVVDEVCAILEQSSNLTADFNAICRETGLSQAHVETIAKTLSQQGVLDIVYPVNVLAKPQLRLIRKMQEKQAKRESGSVVDGYKIEAHHVPAQVSITECKAEPRPVYAVEMPEIGPYTEAVLAGIRDELAREVPVEISEILDTRKAASLQEKFYENASKVLNRNIPNLDEKQIRILSGVLLHTMQGLGELEMLMADDMLEEIAVNGATEPVCVYHRKHGWLKTNIYLGGEEIYNYSSQIGRKAGRDITLLNPILDAHMTSGDRVNATLFPISTSGDTLTIRRFAREPWTMIDFTDKGMNTLSLDMAAFLWQAIQYELNIVVAGGTASGKTSMLNTLCAFIPPSSRTVTIEDTRELSLPSYLKFNWVPLTTRNPNAEGKGEVSMLDLMVTSLRMRPDRIILGEIRKRREAEVLFEAMHTGHAVYSTMHADTSSQVLRRLTHPPFELPTTELESLHLLLVMHRDRKRGLRRAYEIGEVTSSSGEELAVNTVFRWRARQDVFERVNKSARVQEELSLHAGMTPQEIADDQEDKKIVLSWMSKRNLRSIEQVGSIMSAYYKNEDRVVQAASKNQSPAKAF